MTDEVISPNVPPGYYEDGAGRQRFWDGSAWTDRYAGGLATVEPTAVLAEVSAPLSAKEQKLLECEEQRQIAEQRKQAENAQRQAAFASSPLGRAQAARDRGDAFFQLEIDVRKLAGGTSAFGSSSNRVNHSGGATDLLGQIEAIGWHLEHVGYVFVETGATTTNRILSTGQGVVTKGVVTGIYLFRNSFT